MVGFDLKTAKFINALIVKGYQKPADVSQEEPETHQLRYLKKNQTYLINIDLNCFFIGHFSS